MSLLPVDQWKFQVNRKGVFVSVRKELGYRVWTVARWPWFGHPRG